MAIESFPRELLAQPPEVRLAYFAAKVVAHPRLTAAHRAVLDALRQPAGASLILVHGPTGVGKTTLRLRLEQQRPHLADARNANLLTAFWRNETRALNGTRTLARNLVQALETLTGRRDLRLLTLVNWTEVLPLQQLQKHTRAWCPGCFDEWRQSGRLEPTTRSYGLSRRSRSAPGIVSPCGLCARFPTADGHLPGSVLDRDRVVAPDVGAG